ncbi:hypothetical protein RD149_23125 [Gordonia westfalica]|uniref:DUF3644 domain-containing protein n=1 Tax=Gordonia westfalica TaxID=158898 RepID=A0ABU2H094_9ACTN|nr:DUF3644 domain-containing protein [Gordonia westfalica]MDS1116644.1 hypothetical protein [Gordonia westfalica]
MKKEVRLLKGKSTASLVLSIEHFNRPWDTGRSDAVLILLDHAFEMLLKSAILHRGGRIREPREKNTIGFDACIRRALSTEKVKFLSDEQALTLQTINGLRDAAQHHIVDLSENQLYFHSQAGVTLFNDILKFVFNEELSNLLPDRVLPISTIAPVDPLIMFRDEVEEVRRLLAPGTRRQAEAEAKLRSLAITDGAIQGEMLQPGVSQLKKIGNQIRTGAQLDDVFPGISGVGFTVDGSGPRVNLRIVKKEGIPVTLVPEGTADAGVVAVKRVDELGFYNLGHRELAEKTGLTTSKATAAVYILGLKDDPDCFKEFKIGASQHARYSQNAVGKIRTLLESRSADEIWEDYKTRRNR